MKIKNILLVLGVLSLLLPLSLAASVSVSPVSGTAGQEITVDVNVDPQGTAEKSGSVFLLYNINKLTYVGVSDNDYFDMKIPPSESKIGFGLGKIEITGFTIGDAKSDAGLWAKVTFILIDETEIAFDEVNSIWGSNVFDTFTPGAITISTLTCPAGTECCGGTTTIDLLTDNSNCGACGTACTATQTCTAGACADSPTCPAGTECCGGTTTIDLLTDNSNCGDCDTVCTAPQTCQTGVCADPTGGPQTIGEALDQGLTAQEEATTTWTAELISKIASILQNWFS